MKKLLTYFLSILGLVSACGQKSYENTDVAGFSELTKRSDVVVLDVRTADEFNERHIEGAVNIDVMQADFLQQAKETLPTDKTIAVYCHSGRRSATASEKLSKEGYQVVNLKGGIEAWIEEEMPVESAIVD